MLVRDLLGIEQLQLLGEGRLPGGRSGLSIDDIQLKRRAARAEWLINQCHWCKVRKESIRYAAIWTLQKGSRPIRRIGQNQTSGIENSRRYLVMFGQIGYARHVIVISIH